MKLGFIADIHGHLEALGIALNVLADHHVDRICFLGDAVGYIPGPGAIPIVQQTCSICLRGNHEAMLLKPDEMPEDRDAIYQLRSTNREARASKILSTVECWPERETITAYSSSLLLVHGSPTEPLTGYIYPDTSLTDWHNPDYTHVICAHTHRPFQRISAGVIWLNCGSVGLPRDDGRYGSAAVLNLETQEAQILRFDITDATKRALRRVGHVAEEVRALYERRSTGNLEGTVVG